MADFKFYSENLGRGKLVRDLLPAKNGFRASTSLPQLSPREFPKALLAKIREELHEVEKAATHIARVEKIADLMTAIICYAGVLEISGQEIRDQIEQKSEEFGSFEDRRFLQDEK